jgi:glycosyltransferase involved in cell wall biosynthesis
MNLVDKQERLVSVGVPVRNGAKFLKLALNSIVTQTHRNLEIIVSDNCSSDDTEAICRELVSRDARVQYHRQESPLTAMRNFAFTYNRARGEYFMFAAHDDLRTDNYVETLLQGHLDNPTAAICCSEIVLFNDHQRHAAGPFERSEEYQFDSRGYPFLQKHLRLLHQTRGHFYGLIKAAYLRDYPWGALDMEVASDHPFLHWLLCFGDSVYVPGAVLYYYKPVSTKSAEQYALETSFSEPGRFLIERISWNVARSIAQASQLAGNPVSFTSLFLRVYLSTLGGPAALPRHLLAQTPPRLRKLARSLRVQYRQLRDGRNNCGSR